MVLPVIAILFAMFLVSGDLSGRGIDAVALRQAEASGRASRLLAGALADALEVAPSVLDADSDQATR